MIEPLIGIAAIVIFVLALMYVDHRRASKTKHAH